MDKFNNQYKNNKHYKSFINDYLKENEKINDVLHTFEKDPWEIGLSICTNIRVVFIKKGLLGVGDIFRTIPINKISSIDVDKGMLGNSVLVIHTSHDEIKFGCQDHDPLVRFYSNIEESRENFISDSKVMSELSEKNEDPIKKIEELSKLKDKGIITVEEFEKSKKKLLDLI